VKGRFYATGIMPRFAEKLTAAGIPLPHSLMEHSQEV
jgi:pilus assembly protein CpaF